VTNLIREDYFALAGSTKYHMEMCYTMTENPRDAVELWMCVLIDLHGAKIEE
jgi:hypothetical protein